MTKKNKFLRKGEDNMFLLGLITGAFITVVIIALLNVNKGD